MPLRRIAPLAVLVLSSAVWAADAAAQARFVTVFQSPEELDADRLLAATLGRELVEAPEELDYEGVIKTLLADERPQGIVARVTPYALVVAEMRGAKLDPIATCRSRSTGRTVVDAFLVVPRRWFPGAHDPDGPGLPQVFDRLKAASDSGQPALFAYRDKLSTSSYFLPSLVFRAQKVFADDPATPRSNRITAVRVQHVETRSSSDLVRAVAHGGADLAAVWSGSRNAFAGAAGLADEDGRQVWFVKLPQSLPCDVIVATRRVAAAVKTRIRQQLEPRPVLAADGSGAWDVDAWMLWTDREAEDAHRALSDLRRQAAAATLPVVVDVRDSTAAPAGPAALDAVHLAVRLSGTELVDMREYYDYYRKFDTRWEVEQIHDGAVRLTVRYDNFTLDGAEVVQRFDISYRTPADLTRRVVSLIHARFHRIRPVWPYMDTSPTVLRDVGFDVDLRVPFQQIQWNDPQRNDYRLRGEPGETRLDRHDPNFELSAGPFPTRNGAVELDPMGRDAYRVLLVRPTPDRTLFQALTVALVALFVLAAAALVWDAWRLTRRPRAVGTGADSGAGSGADAGSAAQRPAA